MVKGRFIRQDGPDRRRQPNAPRLALNVMINPSRAQVKGHRRREGVPEPRKSRIFPARAASAARSWGKEHYPRSSAIHDERTRYMPVRGIIFLRRDTTSCGGRRGGVRWRLPRASGRTARDEDAGAAPNGTRADRESP